MLTTSCSSALSVTSTQDKSNSTSSFDHFSVSFDLLFVRNQAILSNCEVPGHWTLPLLLPVGKWKISVASNKYFSVGCLCVYVSIALRLSPLLPGLAPQLRDFLCVIVPSLFLYYPTLRYHGKNRLLLRGRLRFFAIVIVFD